MRSLALGLVRLSLGFYHGMRDPEFQAIIFLLAMSVLGGSIFYHSVEGWSWLDSAYFSVVALTTVGDANPRPTHRPVQDIHEGLLAGRESVWCWRFCPGLDRIGTWSAGTDTTKSRITKSRPSMDRGLLMPHS